MKNFLMVPVQIDALYVDQYGLSVVDQMADFSVLPFVDEKKGTDVNADTANLSESVLPQPFMNTSHRLGAGIHLHWAMPDALTIGDTLLTFPPVPNRWLISRYIDGKLSRQWVVESDYLYPVGTDREGKAVTVPVSSAVPGEENGQPFRFMGRSMPLSAWKPFFPQADYFPDLSVIGYGNPNFAAFYPNCFSVFGFHDALEKESAKLELDLPGELHRVNYEVSGWYSDSQNDPVSTLVRTHLNHPDPQNLIKEAFDWECKEEGVPQGMVCVGGLKFGKYVNVSRQKETSGISVSIANTPTEALSAKLAKEFASVGNYTDEERKTLERLTEDRLEAMQLSFRLDEKKLDTIQRFKSLRHENGFVPSRGESKWVIRKENVSSKADKEMERTQEVQVADLPESIADALIELNHLQNQYARAWNKIKDLRQQLFADWYKYMLCLYPPGSVQFDYPDPDLVKHFIEKKSLPPLESLLHSTGTLQDPLKDEEGNITQMLPTKASHHRSLAVKLAQKLNRFIQDLYQAVLELNSQKGTNARFLLEQVPGPRFWEPSDPVILLEGEGLEATERHGQDGTLECYFFASSGEQVFEAGNDFSRFSKKVTSLISNHQIIQREWKQQPWNPIMLEWGAQFFPSANKTNYSDPRGLYDQDFIVANYYAPVHDPDLTRNKNQGKLDLLNEKYYSGSCIITAQANQLLCRAIESNLIERLGEKTKFTEAADILKADRLEFNEPIRTMIWAYQEVSKMSTLSQALDGFNQAMLMRKNTLELEVADPVGFPEYRHFSNQRVSEALGRSINSSPQPNNSFHPIRSGCLKIKELRLVDTFGQTREVLIQERTTTYKMEISGSKELIHLQPRLLQPARFNFRWLNARKNLGETISHESSSPICGWVLPNRFDKSLVFFNSEGKSLGFFKGERWHYAIDGDRNLDIDDIPNPHLRRVAQFVKQSIDEVINDQGQGNTEIEDFVDIFNDTLLEALANIQPEGNNAVDSMALLVGRPMAVVRATLNLELRGLPAVNQDWNVFRKDIQQNKRTSDGFTKVSFPVRLGEYDQLNDGLAGYWLEDKDENGFLQFAGGLDAKFYSTQVISEDTDIIDTLEEDSAINFFQSLDAPARTVTMLLDVQGSVHATVGILPKKEITIPPLYYEKALKNIEVFFLHAPLITPKGKLQLSLTRAQGNAWSWVEKQKTGKVKELFAENRMEKEVFIKEWEKATGEKSGEVLWAYLLKEWKDGGVKWLKHVDDDEDGEIDKGRAAILNDNDRGAAVFVGPFVEREELVESIFDRFSIGIDPAELNAIFQGKNEIREGWLKLRSL